MKISVFTLFPEAVSAYCTTSILGRAQESGALSVDVHDLRDGAEDTRRTVDDSPFGGGAGMVLMPEPVFRAVEAVEAAGDLPRPLLLLAPGGRRFDQAAAEELAAAPTGFSLLCGRYEGVDQRVSDHLVDGELSVGDFVLAGGELAALVVVETVARLLPEVLGNDDSALHESFSDGLLEYPQYTRPAEFRGWEVPAVLRSGDHAAVASWRRTQALLRTAFRRPDLLEHLVRASALSDQDVRTLAAHGYDVPSGSEP
ncbi:MAG TPA: tRNA (guanosine(37)-N1)-methyltransferase TrmD [Acidimicrobiales bacterium]|nr:tRNA (guanosine(37)-N1)-methyltransferase TrmD [Acidimicrobiales bacterium]